MRGDAISGPTCPQKRDICVHTLISEQVAKDPTKTALYCSKAPFTYTEMNYLATQLAVYLRCCGVGVGSIVPLCFEQSIWTVIAMLAVMKASAAFLALDAALPISVLKHRISQTGCNIMVVSPATESACRGLTPELVSLTSQLLLQLSKSEGESSLPDVPPDSPAYLVYTSGSTGPPKAVIVGHAAISTALPLHAAAFDINAKSRVLQFSSYAFDASICEILATLTAGGTLCVPSEAERLDNIAHFMINARVDTALLTPSFAATFTPDFVPCLKTLVLCGEAPTQHVVEKWFGHVKLINAYGPTETCISCAAHTYGSQDDVAATIGCGYAHSLRVVDPEDHDKLMYFGGIGELVVGGPALAWGYWNDPERTEYSFVKYLQWISGEQNSQNGIYYKTGDLVRYNDRGLLEYIGRKDTYLRSTQGSYVQ